MDDTKKMFRAVINGQSAMKQELLTEIKKVRGEVGEVHSELGEFKQEASEEFKKVNSRLDKIGKSVAYLEDDTPTRDEHDKLEKRVTKLEHKVASSN